jgi:protein-tyrosine phosphatase
MKIMFVCHGNICRSPMAESIMSMLIAQRGLGDRISVASSATSPEEIYRGVGNPIYPPAKAALISHGVPPVPHRATLFRPRDYDLYDMIVCMDKNNLRNLLSITGGDKDSKISLLLEHTARGGEVSDPYYYGGFDKTFSDIYEGCRALLDKLTPRVDKSHGK